MLHISQLYIYPIKSLGGIPVNSAQVTSRGFKYDRRWMLVDGQNRFLTQREHPPMALIKTAIEADGLLVSHYLHGSIKVPYIYNYTAKQNVTIWDDTTTGVYINDDIDHWFSTVLDLKCRLVYMPDDAEREVDQRYAQPGMITSFADAYPFLLIGQASLNDLNSRLPELLPMDRFRPNIVLAGGRPFEEDVMNHITIAGINFYGVKLCSRCVMTTINQQTGVKAKEPLKTLAAYRSKDKKILFGQNLVHQGEGIVTVGDSITVLSTHSEDRFIIEKKKSA